MVDVGAQTKEFERKLREVEEDGADPLSVWSAHLEWLEANKLARHECYKKFLQRCVQYFSWSNMSGYKSDYRLATIYLKMAKICTEPIAIYQHMLENNIGPHYAPFYDTYATALSEKGRVEEAVKLVERAMAQNAQPMKKLQLRLEALKQSQVQPTPSTLSTNATSSSKPTTTPSWEDEPCERNDAFYNQPGVKLHYPKELVYPQEGGEVQLELVKARLPQYTPSFLNDSEGECDMDMTMAGGGHITVHVPCVPDLFKPGAMQLVQSSSSSKNTFGNTAKTSLEDKENMRGSRQQTGRTVKPEQDRQRKPLQSIKPPSLADPLLESEQQLDELELLCAEQDQELLQKSQERLNPLRGTGERHLVAVDDKENAPIDEEDDEFARQMEQLMIERDQAVAPPTQTLVPPLQTSDQPPQPRVEEVSVVHRENLSYLKDQENQPRERAKPSGFEFTPGSMEGGLHWPAVGQKNANGFVNTRLNFSEADSTFGGEEGNSSRHHLSSSFGRATFNSTLDLERRAKVTDEQLKFESEFANTEVDSHGPWKQRPGSAFSQLQTSSVLEPSLSDSQSFEVFHDSWAHHSRNTSRGGNVSNISRGGNVSRGNVSHGGNISSSISGIQSKKNGSFQTSAVSKPIMGERRPLQELPVPRSYAPPTELSLDHTSYTASQSSMTSFSVFEDESCADQSSLAPFHDSWSNAPPPGPTGQNQKHQAVGVGTRIYHAPLEAPIMQGGSDNRERGNLTMEQSFTQFDIRHPTSFEPVSTPMGARSALAWDVSAIPESGLTEIEFFQPSKDDHTHAPPPSVSSLPMVGQQTNPQSGEPPLINQKSTIEAHHDNLPSSKPAPVMITHPSTSVKEKSRLQQHPVCLFNLSTITEESGSYKSSSSGSRLTVSSASSNSHSALSGGTPHSQLTQHPPEDVNPFEQHIVNMMLNTLGVPVGRMEKISGNFPRIISGHSIEVGGERYDSVRKLAEGGFAKVYVGKHQGRLEAFKVQSPSLEWELAVIEGLHTRLNSRGLQMWMACFIEVNKAYRFDDASVLTMQYFPQGSLLDLVNAYNSNRSTVPEPIVLYYGYEMLSILATLHQCGIVHADVKPDNFMLKDLRPLLSGKFNVGAIQGKGVCLIDFGCSIDTHVFPEETMFVGSSETDAFQCPAMIEGRPWKWQADYYGLAATFHVLIQGGYMEVKQETETGLYKPKNKISQRRFDVSLWNPLFDVLLNSPDVLPLAELASPLEEKLKREKSVILRQKMNACCDMINNYMKTKLK